MLRTTVLIVVLAVLSVGSSSWAMGGGGINTAPPVDLLLPGPPRNVVATAGDGLATISFDPPKSDGGSQITGYSVKSRPEGMRAKGKKSPIVIRGLTNGKVYTFSVDASNSVGTGLSSGPSNSVTPGQR
jgi:hypothetical protein